MQSGAFSDSFEQFLEVNRIHILLMKTFYSWKFFWSGNTVGEKRKSAERRNNYRLWPYVLHVICT